MNDLSRNNTSVTTDSSKLIKNHLYVITIVWAALLFSLVVYLGIMHTIPANESGADATSMLYILIGTSVIFLFIGNFCYKKALSRYAAFKSDLKLNYAKHNKDSIAKDLGSGFVMYIISLALTESIGLYGLVYYMISGQRNTAHLFFAVAMITMFLYGPQFKIKRLFN